MKLQIGEMIKKLRLQQGITQEKLAEILGVSCQSVSRWELGVCYPDMELLPALANYFNVTLDELMGMNGIRSDAKQREIFTRTLDLERQERWTEAVLILRESLKVYPHNDGLMSELAMALTHLDDPDTNAEAISLSEKILAHSTNEKIRSTTRANLCSLYKTTGQTQKALELGRTLPHIWESREILLPDLVPEQDRSATVARSLDIANQVLADITAGNPIPFSLGYKPSDCTSML